MMVMTDARHQRSLSPVSRQASDRGRADAVDMRASDADRDRTATVLGSALATGRLTRTEYAERLDATYTATTLGDLAPLTRDLPAEEAAEVSVRAAVHRGHYDPSAPWQHWQQLAQDMAKPGPARTENRPL
jgi:hypothetical protein